MPKPEFRVDPDLRHRPWPQRDLERLGTCPVCGCERRSLIHDDLWDNAFYAAPGTWTMWRCDDCRSGYLDPRPTPSSIGRAYSRYYTHKEDAVVPAPTTAVHKMRKRLVNGYRNARFGTNFEPTSELGNLPVRMVPPLRWQVDLNYRYLPRARPGRKPRVLDIGCGNGAWLAVAETAGYEACGAEPDPVAQTRGREAGYDIRVGGDEAWLDVPGSFDAVTMSHVIEHVHNPVETLRNVFTLLRPGGVLFIDTPDIDAPGHATYGPNWRGLETPRHLAIFNSGSLKALLLRQGFTDIRSINRMQPTGWLAEASERMAAGLDPEGPDSKQGVGRVSLPTALMNAVTPSRREFVAITCKRPLASS